jgi:hypothetical protein
VAVSYDEIRDRFDTLRRFLLDDLDLVVTQPVGGNYAAVLLITAACDAVGRLRYGTRAGGEPFFAEYLLPARWRPVGAQLFDALRNGLAHAYDTKIVVQIGDRPIEVVVSRREDVHLSFDAADCRLFVNVEALTTQLKAARVKYDGQLKQSAEFRDRFTKWINRDTTVNVVKEVDRRVWKELLGIKGSR